MEGDMISVSGYEVSPIEVEEGLLLHPAIAEAAVIGVPDAYLGQAAQFVRLGLIFPLLQCRERGLIQAGTAREF